MQNDEESTGPENRPIRARKIAFFIVLSLLLPVSFLFFRWADENLEWFKAIGIVIGFLGLLGYIVFSRSPELVKQQQQIDEEVGLYIRISIAVGIVLAILVMIFV